tara:strand:+ start:2592 stop:2939 length:348 start_codon:yes stop_codon:yes gene_type:complete
MSEFLQEKIKAWVKCDNNLNTIKTQSKVLRTNKSTLTDEIFTYVQENNLDNSIIQISDGTLKFQQTNYTSPLTFKLLESCLHECISDEEQVKKIIKYVKCKRETRINCEIKRKYN